MSALTCKFNHKNLTCHPTQIFVNIMLLGLLPWRAQSKSRGKSTQTWEPLVEVIWPPYQQSNHFTSFLLYLSVSGAFFFFFSTKDDFEFADLQHLLAKGGCLFLSYFLKAFCGNRGAEFPHLYRLVLRKIKFPRKMYSRLNPKLK